MQDHVQVLDGTAAEARVDDAREPLVAEDGARDRRVEARKGERRLVCARPGVLVEEPLDDCRLEAPRLERGSDDAGLAGTDIALG